VSDSPQLEPSAQGKVRDLYDLGDTLIIVATDRLSAFDVVLPDPIPHKGEVLTKLSLHWFELLGDIVPDHLLSADVADLPETFASRRDWLRGRFMLVRKATVFPVECIVRGYLAGSGWMEYRTEGTLAGVELPAGLRESEQLPVPLFTPSTKAEIGSHDENITVERMLRIVGEEHGRELVEKSLAVYSAAAGHAAAKGILIADTKFEFGLIDGVVTLVDEVLTPDSSRFWPAGAYEPGHGQASFDKQFVRDWLSDSGWDFSPPAPKLPREVIARTSEKYVAAYELITGRTFSPDGTEQ
jgi:phosphoribosylaminoimidazole-succinocarboxamide synthase